SVAIRARVDGEIVAVRFKEGDPVKSGAVLFELDPRPFVAALDQAKANLAKDRAQFVHAQSQDSRYQDLLRQKFISPDAYEQVRATAQSTAASVKGDEAAVETAQLQLGFCTIRSPLDGIAGRIQIQQGNLVRAGDANPLVTINKIIPVTVTLTLYEQKDALVAPSAAVQNGPNGPYVFVVRSDNTVEVRNIKVARAEGDDTVIASGLTPGDRVVTVGQLRLAPGTRVAEAQRAKSS